MRFIHIRNQFFPDTTLGTLNVEYDDGGSEYVCETLENVDRKLENNPEEKVYGRSAIPRGRYQVSFPYSPKYDRPMLQLHDVPGFTGIRIHAGNTHSDTDGCILVGLRRYKRSILSSRVAVERVENLVRKALASGDSVIWEIV